MCVLYLQTMLSILKEIEPKMQELKITRNYASSTYPELLKILRNHFRSSDYSIKFVKKPLGSVVGACDCK